MRVAVTCDSRGERIDDSWKYNVLDTQYACGERVSCVALENGNGPRRQRCPLIVMLRNEMYGHRGFPQPGREDRFMDACAVHASSAESWQRPRMNIHDPAAIPRNYTRRHQPKVTCEDDQLYVAARKDSAEIVFRSRIEDERIDARVTCPLERAGRRAVRGNEHDLTLCGVAECGEVIEYRLQIRAAAGCEHPDAHLHD